MKTGERLKASEDLEKAVQFLKGVGPYKAKLLKRLGIETVEDLLYFIPWRYEDRSLIKNISDLSFDPAAGFQTIVGTVGAVSLSTTPVKGMKIVEVLVSDATGHIVSKWFNQPYLKQLFKNGQKVILSGPVKADRYLRHYLDNPHYEMAEEEGERTHTGRIVPIYHETRGLSSRQIRALIRDLLESREWDEFLPEDRLSGYRLPHLKEALMSVHFPEEGSDLRTLQDRATRSHKRLSYEEFLLMELGLALRKRQVSRTTKAVRYQADTLIRKFLTLFPYPLTSAQQRVFQEIRRDMLGPHPMHRLIQGDVGCGKTVIALLAMLLAVDGGYQSVLMAPTEILAEQHYLNLKPFLEHLNVACDLLTGGVKPAERKRLFQSLGEGKPGVIVGTHALAEEGVTFGRLALAVIDEQHKFGVLQRAALKEKGRDIDLLVMTATPIPRTLAMSLYGDLDVSVVDELPPGRLPVVTRHYRESQHEEAYRFLAKEIRSGRQGYIVYPLVEESEKVDLKAAKAMAQHLAEKVFPEFCVGLLHGKMKRDEKEKVMSAFKSGRIQILAATTVIEVGVDVPNASVMIVEHAERFGLAQLHQLRGRVGRGGHASYCLLVSGGGLSPEAWKRIQAMVQRTDGFKIAEEDLRIRGPGEFFGTRQSGIPELRVADLVRDGRILETARKDAFQLVEEDPYLAQPEHLLLRRAMERRWKGRLSLGTV